MLKTISPIFVLAVLVLTSCVSNQHTINFQNSKFSTREATEIKNQQEIYRIQSNDVLSIRVKSLDPQYSQYLNIEPEGGFSMINPESLYVNGYTVSETGHISFPAIGKLKVEGLTVSQIRDMIQKEVDEELNDATVFVTLVSFKVSILGEVAQPGYYFVYNSKANVMEALALAGDMGQFANRREILLIRQTETGSETILLDLTKSSFLESPYYYLLPNDVIYVPALQVKNQRSNLANLNILSTAFAGISTAITVILLIRNNR